MNHLDKRFIILRSINFGLIIFVITYLTFSFFDLAIFKFSRTLSGQLFWFFENIVDLISDIVDPLNIALLSIFFLSMSMLVKNLLKEPNKKKLMESKFKLSSDIINETLKYYELIFQHIIISIIFSGLLCHILKFVFGVSRPKYYFLEGYERFDNFNLLHKINSLPSGHTQAAFTITILFIIYVNRFVIPIILVSILIGLSRIFLSMHFPSDIILGGYIGLIGPILTYFLIFQRKFALFNKDKILKAKVFLKILCYKFYI